MPRDYQRQKLYEAERAAFRRADSEQKVSMTNAQVLRLVKRIAGSKWWLKQTDCFNCFFGDDLPDVEFQAGKRERRYATASYRRWEIFIPDWARVPWVIIHELAHLIDGAVAAKERRQFQTAVHGRSFARLFLEMIRRYMSKEDAARLLAEYKRLGVCWQGSDVHHFKRIEDRKLAAMKNVFMAK